jgi:hypothetical protein
MKFQKQKKNYFYIRNALLCNRVLKLQRKEIDNLLKELQNGNYLSTIYDYVISIDCSFFNLYFQEKKRK